MDAAETQHLHAVKGMTGFELACIEADELHPMYEAACAEIDARLDGGHAIDEAIDDENAAI